MIDVAEVTDPVAGELINERQLSEQLLKQAKEQGVDLVGADELLRAPRSECETHSNSIGENARSGIGSRAVLIEVGLLSTSTFPRAVRERSSRKSSRIDSCAPPASTRSGCR
jgi:hypothetical protein